VPLSHEIFHCVYDLKEKPQVPSIHSAQRGDRAMTWEYSRDGSDTSVPHYRAITDDEDRIMVFICHNTDLGDGWEREGEDRWYFEEFSVKKGISLRHQHRDLCDDALVASRLILLSFLLFIYLFPKLSQHEYVNTCLSTKKPLPSNKFARARLESKRSCLR
jgi:hypothetical protein